MWKNCPHWLHIKPKILTAQSSIFFCLFSPSNQKNPSSTHSRFPTVSSYFRFPWSSTQFAISLHFSLVLPVSSVYLTSLYTCLVHQHGMFSPLCISILHKLIPWIFSPCLLCIPEECSDSKRQFSLKFCRLRCLRTKNLPSWLCSVIVMVQQWPKITQIRKLPLEVQYYCEIQGHISFLQKQQLLLLCLSESGFYFLSSATVNVQATSDLSLAQKIKLQLQYRAHNCWARWSTILKGIQCSAVEWQYPPHLSGS